VSLSRTNDFNECAQQRELLSLCDVANEQRESYRKLTEEKHQQHVVRFLECLSRSFKSKFDIEVYYHPFLSVS
jgi:hypothetical protein